MNNPPRLDAKAKYMSIFPDWVHAVNENLEPWLGRLMEPGEPYGRFRHADKCMVGANLASSAFAVSLHEYFNMLPLNRSQKDAWAQWFGDQQDPDSGQFVDVELERHLPDIERHGRSALWNHRRFTTKLAQSAMLLLGHLPPHPTTEETLGFDPQHETIEEHLQTFDWDQNPWAGGSAASSSLAILDFQVRRGQELYLPIIERGILWLESQQDPRTGLWGSANCHHRLRINAALKVITRLYSTFRRPLQYPDQIIDSVLLNWADEAYFNPSNPDLNGCDEMNTLVLAAVALRFTDHRRDEVSEGAKQRIEKLRPYLRSDGVFSLTPNGSILKLNDIPMTYGEDQGDIHGVNLVCNAFALIADILGATEELGWRFHGFHYKDWLLTAGCYKPIWNVADTDTYTCDAASWN